MTALKIRAERQGIMLAQPLTERKLASVSFYGKTYAQPKLNGERCRVQWFQDEPYLISSYGNEFHFTDKIRKSLFNLSTRFGPLPYDGEIYNHTFSRERIDSALRRRKNYNSDVELLEFHIFDLQTQTDQYNRFCDLTGIFSSIDPGDYPRLHFVKPTTIDIEDWQEQNLTYIEEGYEGIILRHPQNTYTNPYGSGTAKRPSHMLKFKPTQKDAYTIIGFTEGEGWCAGMLGSFLVQGHDGTQFSVGTGPELTKAKRIEYWSKRDYLLNRQLLVKYEPTKTTGGIPLCTVAYKVL